MSTDSRDRDVVLWRREARFPASAEDPLPSSADVVVVGAGYTGATAALHLAESGRKVVVLERGRLGEGASARNAGFAHSGLRLGPGQLKRKRGDLGLRLYEESRAAMQTLAGLIDRLGIDCGYERRGYMHLARRPRDVRRLEATQATYRETVGQESTLLRGDELAAEIGTYRYAGGLVVPIAAAVQPALLLAGLLTGASDAGAALRAHTAAVRIEAAGDGAVVETGQGAIRARHVVVATNGYSDGVVPWLQRRVIPIESFIVATEPLSPSLQRVVSPGGHLCFETRNFLSYWRTSDDGRLIFGGRSSFAPTDVGRAQHVLERRLREIYPELADVRTETAWGGRVAFTFDQLPHIARRGPVVTAAGCCGGGVALSTQLGRGLAAVIDGGHSPFAQLPFPSNPLYRGRPWFLRPLGALLRLEDRIR